MKFRPTPPLLLLRRLVRSIETNGIRGAVVHSCQRLVRSFKKHGLCGTYQRAFVKAPTAPRRGTLQRPHSFDLFHNTDTGGYISGADFAAVSLSALYTTAYLGISPSAFRPALADLPIRYEDFTFIDLGCGKGRAVILASEFPFRRLIGVELAGELCRTAESNLSKNPDWETRISVVNEDATTFILPEGPLLIYLYDPFLAPILRRVLESLERQLRRSPRPVYVLYAKDPHFTAVLDSFPSIRQIAEREYPLSFEDISLDPLHRTRERFTLYAVDVDEAWTETKAS